MDHNLTVKREYGIWRVRLVRDDQFREIIGENFAIHIAMREAGKNIAERETLETWLRINKRKYTV